MLRRVNAALFEAPFGARIQLVAESQNNNGVNDARFEYANAVLPREVIMGLPGCSFNVGAATEQLESVVAFSTAAGGNARYDLFEVENGVMLSLGKSVRNSGGAPLIAFAIDPTVLVVPRGGVIAAQPPIAAGTTARNMAPRTKTTKKKAAKKKTAKKKAPKKKTAKKKTRKTATKRSSRKGSSRKRK